MTEHEALRIWDRTVSASMEARTRQLGNGEWVVILKKNGYYLWSLDDWKRLRNGHKHKPRKLVPA